MFSMRREVWDADLDRTCGAPRTLRAGVGGGYSGYGGRLCRHECRNKMGEMKKESVKAIRLVTGKGEVVDLNASNIEFGYRHAQLPRGVVVGVWLQLKPGAGEDIERQSKTISVSESTQPLSLPAQDASSKSAQRFSRPSPLKWRG